MQQQGDYCFDRFQSLVIAYSATVLLCELKRGQITLWTYKRRKYPQQYRLLWRIFRCNRQSTTPNLLLFFIIIGF